MKFRAKHTLFTISIVVSILFGASSCAPVYFPNTVNVPNFKEKGELQAAVYASNFGVDGQLAYSATDHLALMANGKIGDSNSGIAADYGKHSFIEFGAGYFDKIGTQGILEFYGGYGQGRSENLYRRAFAPNDTIDAGISRIFLQWSFGIADKWYDVSLANRFSYVTVREKRYKTSVLFLEPVATVKLGSPNMKFVIQSGLSFHPYEEIEFDYEPLMISVGIHARLNTKN